MVCEHCEDTGERPALIAGDLRPCPFCDGKREDDEAAPAGGSARP